MKVHLCFLVNKIDQKVILCIFWDGTTAEFQLEVIEGTLLNYATLLASGL